MDALKEPITIEEVGRRGDGIARIEDTTVIAPKAAPGETIQIITGSREGDRFHVVHAKRIEPESKNKPCTPACRHYGSIEKIGCGGCSIQHIPESDYKEWKEQRLLKALNKEGIEAEIDKTHFLPPYTRRRVVWHIEKTHSGEMLLGYFKPHSHELVDIAKSCPILCPEMVEITDRVRDMLAPVINIGETIRFHLSYVNGMLDGVIERPRPLNAVDQRDLKNAGKQFLHRLSYTRDGLSVTTIHTGKPIIYTFDGISIPMPPLTFLQATEESEKIMQAYVTEHLKDKRRIVDLFCGLGTLTVPVANMKQTKGVMGFDSAKAAVDALDSAGRPIGIKALVRDLYRKPLVKSELNNIDAAIIDPPRAGAEEQFKFLARAGVERIISISCNPDTFAKDAKILTNAGYTMKDLTLIDQFIWSHHLEIAAVFNL